MSFTGFPRVDIPDSEKNDQWLLEWCIASRNYGTYLGTTANGSGRLDVSRFSFDQQGYINSLADVNRTYSQGSQSAYPYMQKHALTKGPSGEDFSYKNIDWSTMPFMKRYIDILLERLMKRTTNILCRTLDPLGAKEQTRKYLEDRVSITFKKEIAKMREASGLEPQSPIEGKPSSIDELELMRETGNYKAHLAMVSEVVIKWLMGLCEYEDGVKRDGIYKDLLPAGIWAVQTCTGENGWPMARNIRAEEIVYPATDKDSFEDAPWMARRWYLTWDQLRVEAAKKGIQAPVVEQMVSDQGISGLNLNGATKIECVYVCLKSTNTLKAKEYKPGFMEVKSGDWQPVNKDKDSSKTYEVVYEAMWVVGSKAILWGGLSKNMPRGIRKLNKTYLPIKAVAPGINKVRLTSYVGLLKPLTDHMQHTWYQIQNLVAKTRPDIIALFDTLLEDVSNGQGGKYAMDELLIQADQAGVLLLSGMDRLTGQPRMSIPIQHLKADETAKIMGLWAHLNSCNNYMMQLIGFNEASAGNTIDPKTLNGNIQMQMAGTEAALYQIYSCVDKMAEMVAEDLFLRTQIGVRDGWLSLEDVFSETQNHVVLASDGFDMASFAIQVEQRMTAKEEDMLETALQTQLVVRNQGGAGGITIEDYIMVKMMPTLATAYRMLALRRRMREKADTERAMAAQEAEMKKVQVASDGAIAKQQELFDQKLQLMEVQGQLKSSQQQQKAQEELQKLAAQMALQIEQGQKAVLEETRKMLLEINAKMEADKELIHEQGEEDRETEELKAKVAPKPKPSGK